MLCCGIITFTQFEREQKTEPNKTEQLDNERSVGLEQLIMIMMHNQTRNSSADEIANVNFVYDDIVHVLQNTTDSCIPPQIDAAVMCGTHVYQIQ